jgi:DNA-binding transcriptional MocR family regulator
MCQLRLHRFPAFSHLQGYGPLVAWARDMVTSLHKPATLQQHTAGIPQQPNPQQVEPVGMDVVITPGASAALDSLVRVLVNPGDPVLVEEFTYAHMAEAHLLPLG